MDVPESASISSGIAERYATALFELFSDDGALDALQGDIDTLSTALADSADLRALIASPVHSRSDQKAAISAVAEKAGLSQSMVSVLGLMAENRRLFVLPQLLSALNEMLADARGEVTAEVSAAHAMTQAQQESLAATLKERFGKDVKIKMAVDESLIGGLVVRVGSKMIDTSIRAKLANLQNAMKEVG
ncbi:MAG: F0F1 ATP synthase subunit delta [Pseudomonadota bacterium]